MLDWVLGGAGFNSQLEHFLPLNLDFGLAGAILPFAGGKRRAGQVVLRKGAQGPDCRFQACLETWLQRCAPGRIISGFAKIC